MQICLNSTTTMLLVFAGAVSPVQGSEQVERWNVFELSLSGPKLLCLLPRHKEGDFEFGR